MKNKQLKIENLKSALELVISKLNENLEKTNYHGDVSDLGNEIGFSVGSVFKLNEEETIDFVHGIRHGISLTNGTH